MWPPGTENSRCLYSNTDTAQRCFREPISQSSKSEAGKWELFAGRCGPFGATCIRVMLLHALHQTSPRRPASRRDRLASESPWVASKQVLAISRQDPSSLFHRRFHFNQCYLLTHRYIYRFQSGLQAKEFSSTAFSCCPDRILTVNLFYVLRSTRVQP